MKQMKTYIVTGVWKGRNVRVQALDYSAKAAMSGVLWSNKKAKLVRPKTATA